MAYLRSRTGVHEIELDEGIETVKDALQILAELFPNIKDLILDDVPEVSFILGERNLLIPEDLDLKFNKDLIIGPIVAGG